jgi:putative sterol carrier protein
MPRFLTSDWAGAVTQAAQEDPELAAAIADVQLTIGHIVSGSPDATVLYTIDFSHGHVVARVEPGTSTDADILLRTDYETAAAIHRGELTAQEAASVGRLKIGGDTAALARCASAIARLGVTLAPLRDATTY